jgi:prepilin-type processing-associated H-X9-DG protein
MRRFISWAVGAVGFLFFLLFLACAGQSIPIELTFYMLTGWVLYLLRSIDQVTVDWPDVFLSLAALVLFTGGLHAFFRWLYPSFRSDDFTNNTTWKVRWTISIVSILMLLFVAGIGTVGIVHQVAWMAHSQEPMISGSMVAAGRSESLADLRDHENAMGNYGKLPPGALANRNGQLLHGWQTVLLPYIGEGLLSDRINLKDSWKHPDNSEVLKTRVDNYASDWEWRKGAPAFDSEGYALSDYASNVRVIGGTRALRADEITDGKSKTILTGEAFRNRKPWGYPANWRDPAEGLNTSPNGFGSNWPGVVQFSFADGHVAPISEDIDPRVLRALATPNGGEEINDPEF